MYTNAESVRIDYFPISIQILILYSICNAFEECVVQRYSPKTSTQYADISVTSAICIYRCPCHTGLLFEPYNISMYLHICTFIHYIELHLRTAQPHQQFVGNKHTFALKHGEAYAHSAKQYLLYTCVGILFMHLCCGVMWCVDD